MIAGNGVQAYSGDGDLATLASIYSSAGVAADSAGNVYISETFNNRIRRVDGSGIIAAFAGNGVKAYGGDGGPATSASLAYPAGIAVDAANNRAELQKRHLVAAVSGARQWVRRVVVLAPRRGRRRVDEAALVGVPLEVFGDRLPGALERSHRANHAPLIDSLGSVRAGLMVRPAFHPLAVGQPHQVLRPAGPLQTGRRIRRPHIVIFAGPASA
jgi:hypothetical protein